MAGMPRQRDPLRQQVRSETRLRYGQSLADLLGARRLNYHQYQRSIQTAEDVAKATKQAADASIPQLKAIYDDADRSRLDAQHQIMLTLEGYGSGSALAQALHGEAALAGQRMAAERAGAQAEAVQRGVDAEAGLAYQKRNALEDFRANRADLLGQTRATHADMAAFAQSRLGELQSAQADADFQQRKFMADTTGIDPVTGQPTLQGRKTIADLTGHDPLTGRRVGTRSGAERRQVSADSAAARDEIATARAWIERLTRGGGPITKAVKYLKVGATIPVPMPSDQVGPDGKRRPLQQGERIKYMNVQVPAIKGDFLRAAAELETRGYLSQQSIHNLRTRNVHVPKQWLPKPFKLPAGFAPEVTRSYGPR